MLTQERLKELLHYDTETGTFTWLKDMSRNVKRGNKAGSSMSLGYVLITAEGKRYLAHRLAWLYVYGQWPANIIDHKDGNPANNRLGNLREATYSENNQNTKLSKKNKCGYRGVHQTESNRWKATIKTNGKAKNLGTYSTPEEASHVYLAAKADYHPFNPTVRA